MRISIIIPHLNQPIELERCLVSLASQRAVKREIEVIVVDNGSTQLPVEQCTKFQNVKLMFEPTAGPGPARNCGVAGSKGEIIAFIDADCIATPEWLSVIERELDQRDELCALGGDVHVSYSDRTNPRFWEPYENVYSYRNEMHIAEGYSGTGNLAMLREVFSVVGPFAGIEVAEDRDWGLRAKGLGVRTYFIADMKIFHPARSSFRELERKWDRHISHDFAEVNSTLRLIGWIIKAIALIISPLKELPTIITSDRISGPYERLLTFVCLARVRFYRAFRMAALLIRTRERKISTTWNRE